MNIEVVEHEPSPRPPHKDATSTQGSAGSPHNNSKKLLQVDQLKIAEPTTPRSPMKRTRIPESPYFEAGKLS
jgi:hypothetical protein